SDRPLRREWLKAWSFIGCPQLAQSEPSASGATMILPPPAWLIWRAAFPLPHDAVVPLHQRVPLPVTKFGGSQVLSFNVADVFQSLQVGSPVRRGRRHGRTAAEVADHPHRIHGRLWIARRGRLLEAGRQNGAGPPMKRRHLLALPAGL